MIEEIQQRGAHQESIEEQDYLALAREHIEKSIEWYHTAKNRISLISAGERRFREKFYRDLLQKLDGGALEEGVIRSLAKFERLGIQEPTNLVTKRSSLDPVRAKIEEGGFRETFFHFDKYILSGDFML
jgi:hypothetical protein